MAMYIRRKRLFDWEPEYQWKKVVSTRMSYRPSGLVEMATLEDGTVMKADYTTESVYVFNK